MRAVMTAASCDDNPLDRGSAHQTWFSFASIDPMFQLEEPFLAVGVNVVADRRASGLDCLAQHLQQPFVQFLQLRSAERCGTTPGPDLGAKQRLVGIDV